MSAYTPTIPEIGPISTLQEMDTKLMVFKFGKLKQLLETKTKKLELLKEKNKRLEKRQIQDDAVLATVNRYWNRMDDNNRAFMKRLGELDSAFNRKTTGSIDTSTSFLTSLSSMDKSELESALSLRVKESVKLAQQVMNKITEQEKRNAVLIEWIQSTDKNKMTPELNPVFDAFVALEKEAQTLREVNTTCLEREHQLSLEIDRRGQMIESSRVKLEELENQCADLSWINSKASADSEKLKAEITKLKEQLKFSTHRVSEPGRLTVFFFKFQLIVVS